MTDLALMDAGCSPAHACEIDLGLCEDLATERLLEDPFPEMNEPRQT